MHLNASQTWTAAWLLSTALLVAGAVHAHRHYATADFGWTRDRIGDVRSADGTMGPVSGSRDFRRASRVPARAEIGPRARGEALALLFLMAQGARPAMVR